ncbi:MAG: LytTR family DNA-binding domain-containing protein [Bacteroidota bacterium]
MKTINCLIVDDEPVAQRIIEGYLEEIPGFVIIGTCNNAIEAFGKLQSAQIDLLFLDIEMPKIKGLDFLRSLKDPPQVILTTAYREFALEGYELEVLDFLLKPISFERFLKAIAKYKKLVPEQNTYQSFTQWTNPIISLKSEGKTYRLHPDELLYIEGMSNYIKVYLKDKNIIVYSSLGRILKKLPSHFIRIHKSYIVNKQHIAAYTNEIVEINQVQLPIGQTYRRQVAGALVGEI